MASIALIDYGSGNLHSAERALRKAASSLHDDVMISITSCPDTVASSDRVVLPGVGHFSDCASGLRRIDGLVSAMEEAVLRRAVPFLGICVGQQLLATRGLEDGETAGLNWIPGDVDRISPGPQYRVAHMGWNELKPVRPHPVLEGLGPSPHVYFTHSYAYTFAGPGDVAALTDYGGDMIAAVARDNMFATQFHPEKSQRTGLRLLANFLSWTPR